jgi:hypothetical protein
MQQELKLRIVSGLILAVIVLAATWYGGLAFRFLSALIALLIYYEWSTITALRAQQPAANTVGWIGQAAIAAAVVAGLGQYAVILLVLFFVIAVGLVFLRGVSRWFAAGTVYAGLTGIALSQIRGGDSLGLYAMLFIFAVVWATDILAYFVGRASGGAKLAPKIYPRQDMVRSDWRCDIGHIRGQPCRLFSGAGQRPARCRDRFHPLCVQSGGRSFRILHQAPLRREGFEPSHSGAWRRDGPRGRADFRLFRSLLARDTFFADKGR